MLMSTDPAPASTKPRHSLNMSWLDLVALHADSTVDYSQDMYVN